MSYTKEIDRKAKEIAELTIKEIDKDCDWALDGEDFQNLEGDEFNEAHSYLMSLVSMHISNKLLT